MDSNITTIIKQSELLLLRTMKSFLDVLNYNPKVTKSSESSIFISLINEPLKDDLSTL